jgi:hypothetical protein
MAANPLPGVHALEFHGDRVLLVDVDGRPYIVLKPAIEALGLAYWSQVQKLQARSWATTRQSMVVAADGKVREMVTVDVRTFLMLLATVDERRVPEAVRPKLVAYQAVVADAIEAYWTHGGAINPRATADQVVNLRARLAVHEQELRLLDMSRNLIAGDWLEAKARHLIARALGEEPEVDPARCPLTVGEYLEEKGIHGAALGRLSPGFGKELKATYMSTFGSEPPVVKRFVEGALRQIYSYTEAHRPLFDAVWAERCGDGADAQPAVEAPVLPLPTRPRRREGA